MHKKNTKTQTLILSIDNDKGYDQMQILPNAQYTFLVSTSELKMLKWRSFSWSIDISACYKKFFLLPFAICTSNMSLLKFSSSPWKHGYLGGDEKFSFKCFLSNTTAVKLSPTVKRPKSNAVTPTGIRWVKSSHWQALFLEQGHPSREAVRSSEGQ